MPVSAWSTPVQATTLTASAGSAAGTHAWVGAADGTLPSRGAASGSHTWTGSSQGVRFVPQTGPDVTLLVSPTRVGSLVVAVSRQAYAVALERVGSLEVGISRQSDDVADSRVGSLAAGSSRQGWDVADSRIDREA